MPDSQKIGEREKGEAIEQFADAIHSNPETIRQAEWIEKNAPEKTKVETVTGIGIRHLKRS